MYNKEMLNRIFAFDSCAFFRRFLYFSARRIFMSFQTTIARRIDYDGVGLHSGVMVHL